MASPSDPQSVSDFDEKRPRMEELAGHWRQLPEEKSFYKYFMSPQEEATVVARLTRRGDREVFAA